MAWCERGTIPHTPILRRLMKDYHKAWLDSHPHHDEEWLFKALEAGFDVHHLDGDHSNNAPENLVLIEHSDHMRLHGGANFVRVKGWDSAEERFEIGRKAYRMRSLGKAPWKDIAERLGDLRVAVAAKKYAFFKGKPWPITHREGCTCGWCSKERFVQSEPKEKLFRWKHYIAGQG